MKRAVFVLAAVICMWPLSAGAEPPSKIPKAQAGILQLGEITIVGRVQKPIASVDVLHVQPKLALAELRQLFVDRIEEASTREPF